MVVVGSFRTRSELRKKPRKAFHYTASVLTGPDAPPLPCALIDVSETGARISLPTEDELPAQFVLMFSSSGRTHRWCRVAWREGPTLGLEYVPAPRTARSLKL